jgi:YHS domain-containing protein
MSALWILIYVALFYFMFRYGGCCGVRSHQHGHGGYDTRNEPGSHEGHHSGSVMPASTDPVCGMVVSEGDSYGRIYRGREYRFCSKACLDRFENDADRFAVEERRAS